MGNRYGGRRFEPCPSCHDAVEWTERHPQTKCKCGAWLAVDLSEDGRTWTWAEVPAPQPRPRVTKDPSQLDILGTE